MAEMTKDEYARSIGLTLGEFHMLLGEVEQNGSNNVIRQQFRLCCKKRLSNKQLLAAKQWLKDHPQD
jgi:hypothetical protein